MNWGRFSRFDFQRSTEFDHQAVHEFDFELGLSGAGFPCRAGFQRIGVFLAQTTVRNIDFNLTLAVAFKACAELVAQTGVRKAIDHLTKVFAHKVLRQFGTVFSPFGLQNAEFLLVQGVSESVIDPKTMDDRPNFFSGALDNDPTLLSVALNAGVVELLSGSGNRGRRFGSHAASRDRTTRHAKTRIAVQLREVWGDVEWNSFRSTFGFVVDLVAVCNRAASAQA